MDSDEILSLSVVDLSKVRPVMDAMGTLMAAASASLYETPPQITSAFADHRRPTFRDLAVRRANTKTFGEGSPRDNYSDMVDIGDMALQLANLYPREAAAVLRALSNCVTYNRHNSDIELHGLSTFYIYGGKSQGEPSLRTYSELGMNIDYTDYLHKFFERLQDDNVDHCHSPHHTELVLWQPVTENTYRMVGLLQADKKDNYLWSVIGGHYVPLFPSGATALSRQYTTPALINGRDAVLVTAFTPRHPYGKILGIRNNAGHVVQKGYDPISIGDKIAFYSFEWDFKTEQGSWYLQPEFTIQKLPLSIHWDIAPDGHVMGFRHTSICCDYEYTR